MLDVIGDLLGGEMNRRHDKAMATNQVRWRVNDAQKAGIQPLAALGLNPVGATASQPSSFGKSVGGALKALNARLLKAQIRKTESEANAIDVSANASVAARNAQSQVPTDTRMVDTREPSVSVGQHDTMARGPGGQYLRTAIGPILIKPTEMLGESAEQNLGEVGSIVNDPVVMAKGHARYRRLKNQARKMYPDRPHPSSSNPKYLSRHRKMQKKIERQRKQWLDDQVRFFLRSGRSYADVNRR